MQPILEIVLPVFAVMMTGYLAAMTPFFSGSHNAALSSFVFNFAIPVMLATIQDVAACLARNSSGRCANKRRRAGSG